MGETLARHDLARLEIRLELPVPGVAAPDAPPAQLLQPAAQARETAGEKLVRIVEDSRVLDHVEKQRATRLDLPGRLENRGKRDRARRAGASAQDRLETHLDREELIDAAETTAREIPGDDQQINIGAGTQRTAADRAEDGARDQPVAIVAMRRSSSSS